jgi:hypothetical protein
MLIQPEIENRAYSQRSRLHRRRNHPSTREKSTILCLAILQKAKQNKSHPLAYKLSQTESLGARAMQDIYALMIDGKDTLFSLTAWNVSITMSISIDV